MTRPRFGGGQTLRGEVRSNVSNFLCFARGIVDNHRHRFHRHSGFDLPRLTSIFLLLTALVCTSPALAEEMEAPRVVAALAQGWAAETGKGVSKNLSLAVRLYCDAATAGGPVQATTTLIYKIYREGFVGLDLSASAAQSVVLMFLVIILTVVQFRYVESKVRYQ